MKKYNENFIQLNQFFRNLTEAMVQETHNVIVQNLPPELEKSHKAVVTSFDAGNSFWSSVSYFLCGCEKLRIMLRMLTVYTLVKHRHDFIAYADSDESKLQFESCLQSAKNDRKHAQFVHMSALSIALKRDILVYAPKQNNHSFKAPAVFQTNSYNQHGPILLFSEVTARRGDTRYYSLMKYCPEQDQNKSAGHSNLNQNIDNFIGQTDKPKVQNTVSQISPNLKSTTKKADAHTKQTRLDIQKKSGTNIQNIRSRTLAVFSIRAGYKVDLNVYSLLHPSILDHYKPVETNPNGDCLRNAISLCMIGTEQMSNDLRLVTEQVMLHNKHTFLRFISQDQIQGRNGTPEETFKSYSQIIKTNGRFGHEYHLIALAIALQCDIYSYSRRFILQDGTWTVPYYTTSSSLAFMFRTQKNGLGTHILYRVPQQLQTDTYDTDNPCCIFYDAAGVHYTAFLPIKSDVTLFRPYTNLFHLRR